jgi:hypothetical protein
MNIERINMNIERINKLADIIEAGQEANDFGFNMETWGSRGRRTIVDKSDHESGHKCGTVACIAGWAVAAFGVSGRAKKFNGDRATDMNVNCMSSATKLLGLGVMLSEELFLARGQGVYLGTITPEHAVRTLRLLAETGEVDWKAAA